MKAPSGWLASLAATPGVTVGPAANLPDADNLVGIVRAVELAGLPLPVPEFEFLPDRRFRFDLAWPELRVAFEREGGTWGASRHTTGTGYAKDCEKYNLAALGGWMVIRATVDMIQSGAALAHLVKALEARRTRGA